MDYDEVVRFVQGHCTDGLVLVIGSGLSCAEGVPGMPAIATHLAEHAASLDGPDGEVWKTINAALDRGDGLESALLKHPPSPSLEEWIVKETCALLVPTELRVMSEVLAGARILRLTDFLLRVLKPASGLPILTPNYDRLIELACEMAGFHVDTTTTGQYAGTFDHESSCMGSWKGIKARGKMTVLEHFPRAVVLKPHGSFDWYRTSGAPRRCCLDIAGERLIITPGLNKYKAGYSAPFDKHRDLANDHIKKAARLLIVGYGFNDDHLQTHLLTRITDGTPTLIVTRGAGTTAIQLAKSAPRCVCLSKASAWDGCAIATKDTEFEHQGPNIWDIGILAKELLA